MPAIPSLARPARALLAAVAAAAVLAACGAPSNPSADCLPARLPVVKQPLVIAIAVHQGAPAPDLPQALLPLVSATFVAGQPVRIVAIDGTPEVLPTPTVSISSHTCDGFTTTLNNAVNNLTSSLRAAKADSNGDNLFEAISVAADTARSLAPGGRATVVIIDSGLPDSGPLNFTKPGMSLTDPNEAADYVAQIRPLDLSGLTFKLLLGYTASPQPALSGTERDNVTAIWKHTITRLGATAHPIASPRPDQGPSTPYSTRLAPVAHSTSFTPAPQGGEPTTTVFQENQVRFMPDSVELADPAAATKALADVVTWLAASPANHVRVTGTTSSAGVEAGRLALSLARAETVRSLLLKADPAIAMTQVQTDGVGTHFPDFVNDRRPDGSLDPLIAPANRTVRITASVSR